MPFGGRALGVMNCVYFRVPFGGQALGGMSHVYFLFLGASWYLLVSLVPLGAQAPGGMNAV